MSWETFQSKLTVRGRTAIAKLGVTDLDGVANVSDTDIMALHRTGKSVVMEIAVAAAFVGVALKNGSFDKRIVRLAETKMIKRLVGKYGAHALRAAIDDAAKHA